MLEDLRIRKYINFMMGILRNKIIIILFLFILIIILINLILFLIFFNIFFLNFLI
jgi:hypothetical protein